RPCAANAPRRAMSRCLASRETRLSTCSGATSRSGRWSRHAATRSSTSSRSSPVSCPIRQAYLLTSRCLIWYRYLDVKILYVDKLFMLITEKGCDMWDAGQYLRFGGERARPFFDLVAQVGATSPRYVVDLGCGPGNLTAALAG